MAVIPSVALTNTFDTWRTRSNDAFARLNAFAIDETSLYASTLTANTSFRAKGTSVLQGGVTMNRSLIVNNNITVSGNTNLGASGKTITATGLVAITGRQTISTNLYVAGNTVLGDSTVVTDRTIINGALVANGNFSVAGNTTIGAAGKTTNATGWFGVTGRATVSTNLFVGGNTTLNGTTTDKSNALSQTLTDGATVSWDTSLGRVATVTIGASRTMAAPTNLKVGTYILSVIQGGSGSYTITWNGVFKWPAGVAPSLTTTVGARDLFTFYSDGTNLYGSYLPDVK
jgi:hypothetical protein